jgi:Cytochrome P460
MTAKSKMAVIVGLAFGTAFFLTVRAQVAPGDGPQYVNGNHLVRPANYREWVYAGGGLGLTYDVATNPQDPPRFGNVFVNPSAYRSFMQTGKWPDGTVLVLESRLSETDAFVSNRGRFQAKLRRMEAEVKDSRFPDGWAFYDFGSADALRATAEPIPNPEVARCIECHTKNTAVERTFVQFYPTLLEAARQKGTVKPGF